MTKGEQIAIVYSSHIGTGRENIGDVLSAQGIAVITDHKNVMFMSLPVDIGKSSKLKVIYGGGGMIRPNFHKREVYKDYLLREKNQEYFIHGVGLNKDLLCSEFCTRDIEALGLWLRGARSITVRDERTKEFLKEKMNISCRVAPCSSYGAVKSVKLEKGDKLYSIGIVPSFGHTYTYDQHKYDIVTLIESMAFKFSKNRLNIICHDESDYKDALQLFGDKANVCLPKSFKDVKKEYSACEKIISLRGHGVIFSAACGLACSPIPLCDKLEYLYSYHYNNKCLNVTFDCDDHLEFLINGIMPVDINTNSVRFI